MDCSVCRDGNPGTNPSGSWRDDCIYSDGMKKKKKLFILYESPLDCKEIQPVHPKGNRSWVFIGRTDVQAETPVFWPPDAKS